MARTKDQQLRYDIINASSDIKREALCLKMVQGTNLKSFLDVVIEYAVKDGDAHRIARQKLKKFEQIQELRPQPEPAPVERINPLINSSVETLQRSMRMGDEAAAKELIDREYDQAEYMVDLRYMAINFPDSREPVIFILEHVATTAKDFIFIMKLDVSKRIELWSRLNEVAKYEELKDLRGEFPEINPQLHRELKLRREKQNFDEKPR